MAERLKRDTYQRVLLFLRQQGRCHWCGRAMLLIAGTVDGASLFRHRPEPDHMATIDHLDSRLSGERGKHSGESRKVAACKACNTTRAAREVEQLPIEELRERSSRGQRRQR